MNSEKNCYAYILILKLNLSVQCDSVYKKITATCASIIDISKENINSLSLSYSLL